MQYLYLPIFFLEEHTKICISSHISLFSNYHPCFYISRNFILLNVSFHTHYSPKSEMPKIPCLVSKMLKLLSLQTYKIWIWTQVWWFNCFLLILLKVCILLANFILTCMNMLIQEDFLFLFKSFWLNSIENLQGRGATNWDVVI